MVTGRDYFVVDLAYSIPETLKEAMETGQRDIVRGLTAIANIMWQTTNPTFRLVELIAEARRKDERYLYDIRNEMTNVMNSVRGSEIVSDFLAWGLLTVELDEDDEPRFVIPGFWDGFVNPDDMDSPDMGIESIGRLLGLCSLARHAEQRVAIGLSSYEPIIYLLERALKLGGTIDRSLAETLYNHHAGHDAGRKWFDLLYARAERVRGQRLFVDTSGDSLIVNPDALRVATLIRERTDELIRGRGNSPV